MLERIPNRVAAIVLLFSFATGCGAAMAKANEAPPDSAARYGGDEMAGMPGMAREASFRGDSMDGKLASLAPVPSPQGQPGAQQGTEAFVQHGPMLIYTASMNLAVFQVAEASKLVETMARESGGFLARRDDTSVQIRVPASKFEDIMKRLEKLGDVLHRNVVAEDVTEQFMDAEVRLKNARAVRDRLAQLLEKATNVEDSLAIEKELTRVGTEIETLEGKLKYLRDRAQYSTITVSFQPKQSDNVKANAVRLPVDWLNQLGLGRLLSL